MSSIGLETRGSVTGELLDVFESVFLRLANIFAEDSFGSFDVAPHSLKDRCGSLVVSGEASTGTLARPRRLK